MDYAQLLAKCDALQEALNNAHERLDNLVAAGHIPMPPALRAQALGESVTSLRDELRPHISYDPM